MEKLDLSKIIEYSFYLLFFIVPLALTPWNYELFEFNKMLITYVLTVIIASSWAIKIVNSQKFFIQKTPIDIPILLFLASQIISTIFSIDRHISIFGYYSRFNGGLLSTICYITLYYAFVTNFPKEKIKTLLKYALTSAFFVSLYGILERLGIDKHIWVQDVQNRVFSTLGQPNWLAAYLAVLIPVSLSFTFYHKKAAMLPYLLSSIFFLTLIFTKSRSGFLGFGFGMIIFWLFSFIKDKKLSIKPFLLLNSLFLILIFIFATPFAQLNKYTLPELLKNDTTTQLEPQPVGSSIIDVGITESGVIRNIVWKGAIDIFKSNPLIGTGVETFAFSYFKYRPTEHNMTSEWDFLYNKAHNEYLNYAATSGTLGLGSYLLIIVVFIVWTFKRIMNHESSIKDLNNNDLPIIHDSKFLIPGLFSAWTTILITNFFGFSVVIIQLFFFLIPAIIFKSFSAIDNRQQTADNKQLTINQNQKILVIAIMLFSIYLLFRIFVYWLSDFYFARGIQASRAQEYVTAYREIKKASFLNNKEPLYHDELSVPAVQLGLFFAGEQNATESAKYINEGLFANQKALEISSNNLNFWKTKTRILYALSSIDDKYLTEAIKSLEIAKELSPTDPKIRYNLALMYDAQDEKKKAYTELEETIRLKINYRDAYLAQSVFYARDGKTQEAREALNFILTRINPTDEEAKKQLEELK